MISETFCGPGQSKLTPLPPDPEPQSLPLHYTTFFPVCQYLFAKKLHNFYPKVLCNILSKNFIKPIDFLRIMCYNNNVPRGEGNKDVPHKALLIVVKSVCLEFAFPPCKARKNFLKTFKKPLDKNRKRCYNKNVPKARN